MKRKFIKITASALLMCLLFSSCTSSDNEETSSPDTTIQTPVSDDNGKYDDSPTGRVPEATENNETAETEDQEEETTLIGTLIGYSSKGYPITEKDGITYVDGVLVANKTYSVPENYNPGALLSECSAAFDSMKNDAAKEGLTLWNASGFRSYELQKSLYTRYSERDGKAAADRYSARPGYSEHQTGLAIDLNTITTAFADTPEGKWVAENCWKYGFILRYPKDKEEQTGYMYEAWHIRYLGTEVAEKIYKSGLCLEEYYGITSVYSSTQEELTEEVISEESTTIQEETTVAATEETTVITAETTLVAEVIDETTEIVITD